MGSNGAEENKVLLPFSRPAAVATLDEAKYQA
jgi:hypothetical protein